MLQINLFQASLRTPRQWLSVPQVLSAAAVVMLVLTTVSLLQWWWLAHSNVRLQTGLHQQQQVTQQLAQLSKQLAKSSNDTELKQTLAAREAELQDKQSVLKALTGKQFGNTHGFVDQITGLARQHIDGVWLTGISIQAGGENLNLQGSTYVAELVPRLLQRLAQEPSFTGVEFKTLLMQRVDKSTRINFDLRSTPKESG